MMVIRFATLFLLWGAAQSGFVYPFCQHGISKANFTDSEPVEVIYAQAPLFSTNPSIGQKGKYLNLYHTCVVLAQGAGSSRRYWTLEFDFTGGDVLRSIVPSFHLNLSAPGLVSMDWKNDARYCLSEGILWGEKHWTKKFDILFSATPAQVQQTFTDFVGPTNTTVPGPQYQLWRVAKRWPQSEMLVQDITCADGAVWFLHHLTSVHNIDILTPNFEFRGTATILNAESVVPVDMNDWKAVDKMAIYFKLMTDLVASKQSVERKLLDALVLLHDKKKYVYDSNSGVYYELSGNKLPNIFFEYAHYPLMGPPWTRPSAATSVIV